MNMLSSICLFFFFNVTAPPEIYTLSLHDALPICLADVLMARGNSVAAREQMMAVIADAQENESRSEEHTSELQSRRDLVCRLLLEKKKQDEPPERQHLDPSSRARTQRQAVVVDHP